MDETTTDKVQILFAFLFIWSCFVPFFSLSGWPNVRREGGRQTEAETYRPVPQSPFAVSLDSNLRRVHVCVPFTSVPLVVDSDTKFRVVPVNPWRAEDDHDNGEEALGPTVEGRGDM